MPLSISYSSYLYIRIYYIYISILNTKKYNLSIILNTNYSKYYVLRKNYILYHQIKNMKVIIKKKRVIITLKLNFSFKKQNKNKI
jgi:hypothetical protein